MNKKLIVLGCLLAVLLAVNFVALRVVYTGTVVSEEIGYDYSYTTALCEGNTCRDHVITCKGGEVVGNNPITGFVTFSEDWVDVREEKRLCE